MTVTAATCGRFIPEGANMTLRRGVFYFEDYATARTVRDRLAPDYPSARIVSYLAGWAVQYRVSGPYFPEEVAQ